MTRRETIFKCYDLADDFLKRADATDFSIMHEIEDNISGWNNEHRNEEIYMCVDNDHFSIEDERYDF